MAVRPWLGPNDSHEFCRRQPPENRSPRPPLGGTGELFLHKFSGAFFGENGETGNFPTLFCEKFPWKNPCRDSRPARQPPAGTTGKTSRKSPAKTPAGAGEIAGRICQKQDRHQWPELCRAAATACRMAAPRGFMRAVSGLYQVYLRPPIVPPSPMQEPPAIPAKSTASTTSTAGRQPAPASTGHQHHQHRGQGHTAQHHQHRQTAHTTAPQPATANTTASQHHTKPGRSARRRRRPARRPPPARPGGP